MKKAFLMLLLFPFLAAALPLQRDIFPPVKGWQSHKDDMVYTQDNLFDLIDGAAEVLLSYGFVDLHVTEYRKDGVQPVRVELYKHSSSLNAFGMYSAERKPEYSFIDIGTQGYIEDGVLNFFVGIYYVKISTDEPKESGRGTMTLIAGAVADFLRQAKGFPPTLSLFPQKNKTANSEGYVAESFLGYKFIHSAYTASYEDTAKIQLFIIPCDTPPAAQTMLATALKQFNADTAVHQAGGTFSVTDQHNGPIYFLLKGSILSGVVHCSDAVKAEEYLRLLEKTL
ncbi:MAG: hypothetical protein NTV54_09230 [Ignavibacteriales bacterium]|nr:hypothetical protein [Ignavibacteriales bacterium]